MKLLELISDDKLDDVFSNLFDMMKKFIADNPKNDIDIIFDELVLIKGDYTNTRNKENFGLDEKSYSNIKLNNLRKALIHVIGQMPLEFCFYATNIPKLNDTQSKIADGNIRLNFEKRAIDSYPPVAEIEGFKEIIHLFSFDEHKIFLIRIGSYFFENLPSRVDDGYILSVEDLLNKLFLQFDNQVIDKVFMEIINESLAYTSFLADRINNGNKDQQFFKEIKQLGRFLTSIKNN